MHSPSKLAGHPAAARRVACLPFSTTTTTSVIPGIDRGVPIILLFSYQCGHCPFLLKGGGGGGGGGGAVGGQFGIIYFNWLRYVYVRFVGYVYVYVYGRCLGYVCVFCLYLCFFFRTFTVSFRFVCEDVSV